MQLSEGSGDQSAAIDRMIAKIFYMAATTPGAIAGRSTTPTTANGTQEPHSTTAAQDQPAMPDTHGRAAAPPLLPPPPLRP